MRAFETAICRLRTANPVSASSYRCLFMVSHHLNDMGREVATQSGKIALIGAAVRNFSTKDNVNGDTIRKDIKIESNGTLRGIHYNEMCKPSQPGSRFTPHPFNRRFALSKRPLFPIEPRNLRILGLLRHKKRGRGKKSSAKGTRHKHQKNRGNKPRSRTSEGGQTPLYRRLPKWPEAWLSRQEKKYDTLNLAKLRYFIEKGRLDTRFTITQRHLHDSKCVRVKNGVHLFNVNDYPFPYKIDIQVASCDQSSINAIKRVGGTISIIYYDRVNLRAHLKPYKFEVLPRTARPDIAKVHELEKLRSRGCEVYYIKPLWLIKEEKRILTEMQELEAEILRSGAVETPVDDSKNHEEYLIQLYRQRLMEHNNPKGKDVESA